MPTRPPVHRAPGWRQRRPWEHPEGKVTGASRGYGYAWAKIRKRVLAEEPWCRYCLIDGRQAPSTTVDHMINRARGGTDERANLCGCCTPCQRSKAGRESGMARRSAT